MLATLAARPRTAPRCLADADELEAADPWGDDLQLALYVALELGYRGFAGVDDRWEQHTATVGAVNALGDRFLRAVAAEVGPVHGGSARDVQDQFVAMSTGDGPSLSGWIEESGTVDHLREFAVHRSAYQLKEADQHTLALPRLPAGAGKAAFVEIQADEYGNGRPGAAHQELFATTLRHLGLEDRYGAYLDLLPGGTLATVNLLSCFGRERRWLGASVGHLALFEMTSVGPMGRYARAVRRLTGSDAAAEFYDVHVVADEHHQRLALDALVGPFVGAEPARAADVVFGARALTVVEGRFTDHLLRCWRADRASLLRPLSAADDHDDRDGLGRQRGDAVEETLAAVGL
jgi:hypothetical protein